MKDSWYTSQDIAKVSWWLFAGNKFAIEATKLLSEQGNKSVWALTTMRGTKNVL